MALRISEIVGNAFRHLDYPSGGVQGGNDLRKGMLNIACSPYDEPILLLTEGTEVVS